jgi:hypothetical protein
MININDYIIEKLHLNKDTKGPFQHEFFKCLCGLLDIKEINKLESEVTDKLQKNFLDKISSFSDIIIFTDYDNDIKVKDLTGKSEYIKYLNTNKLTKGVLNVFFNVDCGLKLITKYEDSNVKLEIFNNYLGENKTVGIDIHYKSNKYDFYIKIAIVDELPERLHIGKVTYQ